MSTQNLCVPPVLDQDEPVGCGCCEDENTVTVLRHYLVLNREMCWTPIMILPLLTSLCHLRVLFFLALIIQTLLFPVCANLVALEYQFQNLSD